jgi:ubiquitin-conjugating enzyme E2 I
VNCIVNEDADWKPAITVRQILIGIQELLDNPNCSDPAQEVPYLLFTQNLNEYKARVRHEIAKHIVS